MEEQKPRESEKQKQRERGNAHTDLGKDAFFLKSTCN